jgi:hypothetical protein
MTEHAKSIAREVHALLADAHPQTNDVNLLKAAHLAEAAGAPGDRLQMQTFISIRNIETAIQNGASAAELERLLLRACDVALRWMTA